MKRSRNKFLKKFWQTTIDSIPQLCYKLSLYRSRSEHERDYRSCVSSWTVHFVKRERLRDGRQVRWGCGCFSLKGLSFGDSGQKS